jgi:uracil-DNA glycosylase
MEICLSAGQDPYHGEGQAHGLCFSVKEGVPPPPSLVNMYKELGRDVAGWRHPGHGCLTGWADQGVLLLNACLTVRKGAANSHKAILMNFFSFCLYKYHLFLSADVKKLLYYCRFSTYFVIWMGGGGDPVMNMKEVYTHRYLW